MDKIGQYQIKEYLKNGQSPVVLIKGHENKTPVFAYIELSDKTGAKKLFTAIEKKQKIDFAEFGRVIIAGNNEPGEEAQDYMYDEYRFPRSYTINDAD